MEEDYVYVIDGDIVVRGMRMPHNVRGYIVSESNGVYNIFINSCLDEFQQKKALRHELEHIIENDFESEKSLFEIENGKKAPHKGAY